MICSHPESHGLLPGYPITPLFSGKLNGILILPSASVAIVYYAVRGKSVATAMRRAALDFSSETQGPRAPEVEGFLWIANGNISSRVVILSRASCQVAPVQACIFAEMKNLLSHM